PASHPEQERKRTQMHRDLVVVPVDRGGAARTVTLRTGRRPTGHRVGYAFTSPDGLRRTLGRGQPWIPLTRSALAALLAPLGIEEVVVDPTAITRRNPHRPDANGAAGQKQEIAEP
ncbi:SAV_915 family protein, partial [Streptomyces sp. WELS2]|uniref:SAV_915 family protein n=1 Tax=Streptomyces sp. WELS2 TaxID=2749435 RepID=UPI0015F0C894